MQRNFVLFFFHYFVHFKVCFNFGFRNERHHIIMIIVHATANWLPHFHFVRLPFPVGSSSMLIATMATIFSFFVSLSFPFYFFPYVIFMHFCNFVQLNLQFCFGFASISRSLKMCKNSENKSLAHDIKLKLFSIFWFLYSNMKRSDETENKRRNGKFSNKLNEKHEKKPPNFYRWNERLPVCSIDMEFVLFTFLLISSPSLQITRNLFSKFFNVL